MNVFRELKEIKKDENTVLTIGTFDGLHLGHQRILNALVKDEISKTGRNFVVTFEPHPRSVVSKNFDMKLLTAYKEKLELFNSYGIENIFVINFTNEFSQQSYDRFVQNYLVDGIGVKKVIVGYDHKLGKDRKGDEDKMKSLGEKFGFEVESIGPISNSDEPVSSTKIRNYLLEGNIKKANAGLGRYYSISGEVVEGAKRGRVLGFPTANIKPESDNKLIPKDGVYSVKVSFDDKKINAVMNIGIRPTFNEEMSRVIEAHLIDFNGNLYGKNLKVEIVERIRDEKKFSSKEELIKQIEIDKELSEKLLTN